MAKTYTCDVCGVQSDWAGVSELDWLEVTMMDGMLMDRHFCSWDCAAIEARKQIVQRGERGEVGVSMAALQKLGAMVRELSPWRVSNSVSDRSSPDGLTYDIEFTFSPHPDVPDGVTVRRSITLNELIDRAEHGTLRALAEGIVNDMMLAAVQPIATEHKPVRLFYGDQMLATFYPNDTTD